MDVLWTVILAVAILIAVWWVAARFSPDPLITKLVQLAIFLIALYLIIFKVLPVVM